MHSSSTVCKFNNNETGRIIELNVAKMTTVTTLSSWKLKELRNYILLIISVCSLYFNTGFSKSVFPTFYFGKLVFVCLSLYNPCLYKCHLTICNVVFTL